ncbi:hypothetical protein BJV78DRAFT_920751 [Lactifluus subvellereus]|nr:hypothetical protein BJV78DRAFT_920751 [Lactifluus subvellereus]
MLPSSQVNTNPFEVPPDPSRTATPTPTPAPTTPPTPNASSSALPAVPNLPSAVDSPGHDTLQPFPEQPSPPASKPPSRSLSSQFVSSPLNPSPLNPNSNPTSPYAFARPRPLSTSRGSVYLNRIASEDSQALGSQHASSQRASMVLWRLATADDQGDLLPPPALSGDHQRNSVLSTMSGESMWSLSTDSKYPSAPPTMRGSLVPYAWDPSLDDDGPDEEDSLHQPDSVDKRPSILNPRGILNEHSTSTFTLHHVLTSASHCI